MCASILIIRNFYNKAIFFGVFILFFIVLYYNYIIFNVLKLFLLYFFDSNFPVSGGPDGELAASMRYLSQRYTMPYREVTGILTDIGNEGLLLHTP